VAEGTSTMVAEDGDDDDDEWDVAVCDVEEECTTGDVVGSDVEDGSVVEVVGVGADDVETTSVVEASLEVGEADVAIGSSLEVGEGVDVSVASSASTVLVTARFSSKFCDLLYM